MATIVLRLVKGAPLTNAEVDANFTNINNELITKLAASSYTAADVLTKLLTVDGTGSGLDADLLDGLSSSATLPVGVDKSSVVTRDTSGNSALNALTLSGALSGTSAGFSGAVSVGTLTLTSGTIPVSSGGTGAASASAARSNLGVAIGVDVQAYAANLAAISGLTSAADTGAYFTGSGTAAIYTLTSYGRSVVAAADASTARSTLGLVIGTNVQPFDSNLSAYASLSTTGIAVRTGSGTAAIRSIDGTVGEITVTNGTGVSGNPTLAVGANIAKLSSNQTFTGTNTFSGATTFSSTNSFNSTSNFLSANNTALVGQAGSLVAYSSGSTTGATLSFHRPGAYGLNLGLDNDNVFRIGGWSAGANRLQLDMSGNFTAAGNVTAYSDERLKKDWADLPEGFVDSLAQVKMGTYVRTDSDEVQVGVSAQSLQRILPQAVNEDASGTLSVSYGNAALASSVALAREIVQLKARLAKLEG